MENQTLTIQEIKNLCEELDLNFDQVHSLARGLRYIGVEVNYDNIIGWYDDEHFSLYTGRDGNEYMLAFVGIDGRDTIAVPINPDMDIITDESKIDELFF